MNRCHDTYDTIRCERRLGHDGLHHGEHLTWGVRANPEPAWVKRARSRTLPAKELSAA
jgi:hypothetical protein